MSLKKFMSALMLALAVGAFGVASAAAPASADDRITPPTAVPPTAVQRLAREAPAVDPQVVSLALAAVQCAQAGGVGRTARRLAVIDYSKPSLQRRLWVFDLHSHALLYREWVAHGSGSGGNLPTHFSNDDGSHASSVGLFVTGSTYIGRNGYSLRMDGLEPGFNDAAMDRAIVMHGADYVNATADKAMGRLGRSWGCPALRSAVARPIIDVMKDGQFVFAYYPEQAWLTRSILLHCQAAQLASTTESAGQ